MAIDGCFARISPLKKFLLIVFSALCDSEKSGWLPKLAAGKPEPTDADMLNAISEARFSSIAFQLMLLLRKLAFIMSV